MTLTPPKKALLWTIEAVNKDIKSTKSMHAMKDVINWEFLIRYHFFFSPQVKRSVIVSNKDGIYELAHKLSSDLRLRNLKN